MTEGSGEAVSGWQWHRELGKGVLGQAACSVRIELSVFSQSTTHSLGSCGTIVPFLDAQHWLEILQGQGSFLIHFGISLLLGAETSPLAPSPTPQVDGQCRLA